MPKNDAGTIEPDELRRIAEYAMQRLLKDVPRAERAVMVRQIREQLGTLLSTTPIRDDAVSEVMIRADLAAAFGATYAAN